MNDNEIETRISALTQEQESLRRTGGGAASHTAQLEGLQLELDRLWDELRRRRAREQYGQDPNEVTEASAEQVEGYHD